MGVCSMRSYPAFAHDKKRQDDTPGETEEDAAAKSNPLRKFVCCHL